MNPKAQKLMDELRSLYPDLEDDISMLEGRIMSYEGGESEEEDTGEGMEDLELDATEDDEGSPMDKEEDLSYLDEEDEEDM